MFIKLHDFKRKWLIDSPAPDASGGGNPPSAPVAPAPDAPVEPVVSQEPEIDYKAEHEKLKAEHEKAQSELTKYQGFHAQASQYVDIDEQGNIKPKAPKSTEPPTPEELDRQRMAEDITNRAVVLSDQNRKAQEKIINEFKAKDPLFASNWLKAQEKIETIPASQRSEAVWRRAYAMAAGENMDGALKAAKEQGKREAMDEFTRQHGASFEGSGAPAVGKDGKTDLSKVVLSREQVREANKMIEAGLISSVDTYKENMVYLGMQEEG